MDRETLSRLSHWLKAERIADSAVQSVQVLSGGTQNFLYLLDLGGQKLVLRRPANSSGQGGDHVIRREARVIASLAGTAVPHAPYRGFCSDRAVIGECFLLTDAIEGYNATVTMPPLAVADPAVRHRMGLSMVEGIASLAEVDPVVVGLADFGKLDGFIERQVSRWQKQLDGYTSHAGWPGPAALNGVEALGVWLNDHQPTNWHRGLMHGDYHIGNVLFSGQGELAAVLDWELSTLGDPLLDLGRLLAAWPDPDGTGPLSLKVEPWAGFPHRDELIEHYARKTGRSMQDLLWFEVLACYKLGIILEGSHARACAGVAPNDVGARLHRSARALIDRALHWLEAKG